VNGVSAYPRTLNGYFTRQNGNGGASCINLCRGLNKGYTFAGTNDNQCWCDTAIAVNGTRAAAPSYGIQDANNNLCSFGCRVAANTPSTTEACGGPGNSDANTQRLSLYEFV
ncbi:hypothetical protein BDU57DRAFT_427888, partial [Ampelomyces quisqualis]